MTGQQRVRAGGSGWDRCRGTRGEGRGGPPGARGRDGRGGGGVGDRAGGRTRPGCCGRAGGGGERGVNGVSDGLGVAAPPPFVPGRAAELARPGPAEGPRMRGAAQCGSMCALPHLKGNEPAALPSSLPPLAHVRRILCLLGRDTAIHSGKRTGLHGTLGESGRFFRPLPIKLLRTHLRECVPGVPKLGQLQRWLELAE